MSILSGLADGNDDFLRVTPPCGSLEECARSFSPKALSSLALSEGPFMSRRDI
jgi:hypothetical protein